MEATKPTPPGSAGFGPPQSACSPQADLKRPSTLFESSFHPKRRTGRGTPGTTAFPKSEEHPSANPRQTSGIPAQYRLLKGRAEAPPYMMQSSRILLAELARRRGRFSCCMWFDLLAKRPFSHTHAPTHSLPSLRLWGALTVQTGPRQHPPECRRGCGAQQVFSGYSAEFFFAK